MATPRPLLFRRIDEGPRLLGEEFLLLKKVPVVACSVSVTGDRATRRG